MPAGSILVADDDTAIRTVLNQALSRAGYEVRLTGNAATLWRWVSQGEGDLVITDVVMPDENAFDLLPRIKKMRPNLPVIVMSAQNTFMTAIRASERGAYEYLPKPFDLKELIAIVGRALAEPKERVANHADEAEFDSIPLVGRSPAMQEIYRVLARLMQPDLTVMISGESAPARSWSHARCMTTASGATARSSPSTWQLSHAISSNRNCSAMNAARSPAPTPAPRAALSRLREVRCFSTKSATCRWRRRPDCYGSFSKASTPPLAAVRRSRPTCASSLRATRICAS